MVLIRTVSTSTRISVSMTASAWRTLAGSSGRTGMITESSFALGVGEAINDLEAAQTGMGQAFYDTLRQALYRWIRVYDDMDARERIEQMTEWAEGEDDPDSYEIPKLDQDLPDCLADKQRSDTARPLASFPLPAIPRLRELVETTIELQRVSHLMERPRLDDEWLERERHYHSLDLPLPAILLYFRQSGRE